MVFPTSLKGKNLRKRSRVYSFYYSSNAFYCSKWRVVVEEGKGVRIGGVEERPQTKLEFDKC